MESVGNIEIEYSAKFLRKLSKLSSHIQRLAGEREQIFKSYPFDNRLKTHKLHGKDKDMWAYSIDNTHRIKFVFAGHKRALYLDVGTHDIYT